MPRMAASEVAPVRIEKPAHDATAKKHVALAIESFHIGAEKVASIMDKEGDPEPEIPGKSEQFPPSPGDEKWMNPNRMDSKKHALSSNSHTELTPAAVLTPLCLCPSDTIGFSTNHITTACALFAASTNCARSPARPRTATRRTISTSISPTGVTRAPQKL